MYNRAMKRIAICILLLIFAVTTFCLGSVTTAAADSTEYLLVSGENVSLYEDTRKAPALFTLPRTYYVKVVEMNYDKGYHKVEYNGIEGIVKSNEFSSTTVKDVSDPYYTAKNVSAHVSTHLYLRPSFAEEADSGIAAYGKTLTYLGKISGEKGTYGTSTWFAVLYSDNVYYIHPEMTSDIDLLETGIPAHPSSVSTEETSEGTDPAAQPAQKTDVVRILLILGMFVPIVIILVVLFRPRKKLGRNRRAEEDDEY